MSAFANRIFGTFSKEPLTWKVSYPCKECSSYNVKILSEASDATPSKRTVFYAQCGQCGKNESERWFTETAAIEYWDQCNKPNSIYPVPTEAEFYNGRAIYREQLESSERWKRIAAAKAWETLKRCHPRLKFYDPPCYRLTPYEKLLRWLMTK